MTAIAYLVLAHGQPFQVIDMLWSIWREEDIYFLHLDRKSPLWSRAALEALAASYPNIRLVPADTCGWGGFSLVEATLRCLLAASASRHPWTHTALVSGTHVPLRRAADLAAAFEPGHSYLTLHDLDLAAAHVEPPTWFSGVARRLTYEYQEVPGLGHMRGPPRSAPDGVTFFWGSQWWVLDRGAVEFICEARHGALAGHLRQTMSPDEIYFQTLLVNSPLRSSLQHKQVVWQQWGTNGHPIALSPQAVRAARGSKCFFARKATEQTFRDPDGGVPAEIASLDRRAWTDSVVEAFARFLPSAITGSVTQAYLLGKSDHAALPVDTVISLRAVTEEIAGIVRAATDARGLAARVTTTIGASTEGRVKCSFPDAQCAARYLLTVRLSTPDQAWVAIHVDAADRAKAAAELGRYPRRDLIDFDFPAVNGFFPFHDVLAFELRCRGVLAVADPRQNSAIRRVIDEYLAVLAAIPGLMPGRIDPGALAGLATPRE